MSACPNRLTCPFVTLFSGVDDSNPVERFMSSNALLLLINNLYRVSNNYFFKFSAVLKYKASPTSDIRLSNNITNTTVILLNV